MVESYKFKPLNILQLQNQAQRTPLKFLSLLSLNN